MDQQQPNPDEDLPATIDRAIDLVLRTHSAADTAAQLIAQGWRFPEDAIAARVKRRIALRASSSTNPPAVSKAPAGGRGTIPRPVSAARQPDIAASKSSTAPPTGSPALARAFGFQRPEPKFRFGVDISVLPDEIQDFVVKAPELLSPGPPHLESKEQGAELHSTWKEVEAALGAEIVAARASRLKDRVPLMGGQVLSSTDSGFVVVYDIERDIRVADGQQVQVVFDSIEHDAEVIALAGSKLQIWIKASSPPRALATLIIDASFLLELRRKFLVERAQTLNPHTIQALLGVTPVTIHDEVDNSGSMLNQEQLKFVRRALGTSLSWLWGPPGTGKTSTLAVLLEGLRRRSKRVLFVSNTNAAIDTALLRFASETAGYSLGEVVRVGPPALGEVRGLATPVTVDAIAASQGDAIAKALKDCQAELEALRARNLAAIAMIDGSKPQVPDDSDAEHLGAAMHRDKSFEAARATSPRVGYLVERRRLLRELLTHLEAATFDRGRVLFATVHQTYLKRLAGQQFDCVIIDEASMVSADLALIAAGYSTDQVVVAGDFRQLGPILQSDNLAARTWLGRSIFDLSHIPTEVSKGNTRANLVALSTQHRMRREIADVVASTSYPENGLHTSPTVTRRPAPQLSELSNAPLVLVDTSDLHPWMARAAGVRSRYNLVHALVAQALACGVPTETSLGLVAPFAPQSALLRSIVGRDDEGRAASTVHRFQGGERDVIVWDSTLGDGGDIKRVPWFADSQTWQEGSRLTNVAISRAREQLVLIADTQLLTRELDGNTTVRRVIRELKKRGAVVSGTDCLAAASSPTTLWSGRAACEQLAWTLASGTDTALLWTPALPQAIPPEIVDLLRDQHRSGTRLYVRTTVPKTQNQHRAAHTLQGIGASIRYLESCTENLALSGSRILTSGTAQLLGSGQEVWLTTESSALAGVMKRLLKRRWDPAIEKGDLDEMCYCGHPATLWVYRSSLPGEPWVDKACTYC